MYKKIEICIYRANLHLLIDSNVTEYTKAVLKIIDDYKFIDVTKEEYLDKFDFCDEGDFVISGGFVQKLSAHDYILAINESDEEPAKLYNTICHEVAHCAAMITLDRGLEHNSQTTEAIAYLSGWLFETVYTNLTDYRAKKKKNTRKRSNKAS